MFSTFFINRPIFASVLSIVIVLAGVIALFALPIAQYPEITPPTVEVSTSYPGANSETVADTVAAPIEQQVNGVENMLYMSSQCTNDGIYRLTVTFKVGTDLNIAQVMVQNRVALAQPILPNLVQREGVLVKKKSPSTLMIVNLYSPKGTRDNLFLSNYATIQLRDELARLQGVGDISYLGQRDYSMRLWLDPQKLAVKNLTAGDVVSAIQQQNNQVSAGSLGGPPVPRGQEKQYPITTLGRLAEAEQFANMIIKSDPQGRQVLMKDVAKIELGAQVYDQTCTLDTRPSVALSIYQLPGSNALEVSKAVKDKMTELKAHFPDDVAYDIVYDTTPFINESIKEVFKTLLDAVLLVALVVLVFLQNWRSTVIPLVAVPVAVVGTFFVMWCFGFSLNNLTLFGLVLAIGIVVDDAIVVVEAVEHHIEHGKPPREATIQAMRDVSGPVIAVGLVLSAVFIPCAFITGITGQFFRQFALTIAVSTVISAFNSLTLSPALSALMLQPREKGGFTRLPGFIFLVAGLLLGARFGWEASWATGVEHWTLQKIGLGTGFMQLYEEWPTMHGLLTGGLAGLAVGALLGYPLSWVTNRLLAVGFKAFNFGFDGATNWYTRSVGSLLRVSAIVLIVYGGLLALTYFGFTHTPTGFIPAQDKGYLVVNVQLPDASSVQRTEEVMAEIERTAVGDKSDPEHYPGIPGVKHTVAISGQSLLLNANAPNFGSMFVMLDDFQERTSKGLTGEVIAAKLRAAFEKKAPDGVIGVFGAPPVEGLGTAGGFKLIIEDRGDNPPMALQKAAERVIDKGSEVKTANNEEALPGLYTSYRANTPWIYLSINRSAAKARGLSMDDVFTTLQVYLGSFYVNDFNKFGRTWEVTVQAGPDFRRKIEDLDQVKIRNAVNDMVVLPSIMGKPVEVSGPVMVSRYNMYPAAAVNGSPGPGVSSGQAITLMDDVAQKEVPSSMRAEWTELALLQLQTGNTAMGVFFLAVVLVFLVLAAQYESWSLPLAVILVVPMCLLCSIAGVLIAHMDVNIFTQIGFVVLVGLACKNAILIVEFAKAQREQGVPTYEATLAACKLRLRPIMMTSFAFILGVVPLVISEGAGAEMRRTLGTAVFAGMLGVTLFGIFLTPVFYYVIQWFADRRAVAAAEEPPPLEPLAAGAH